MNIEIGEEAIVDLEEIYMFSYKQFGEMKAKDYMHFLEKQIEALSNNPQLGTDYSIIRTGLRRLVVESHCVFYGISSNTLKIYRVLHQSRDVQRYFP